MIIIRLTSEMQHIRLLAYIRTILEQSTDEVRVCPGTGLSVYKKSLRVHNYELL